jgi:hypothetical protein
MEKMVQRISLFSLKNCAKAAEVLKNYARYGEESQNDRQSNELKFRITRPAILELQPS